MKYIDNIKITVLDEIEKWILKADEVIICSPFISSNSSLSKLVNSDLKLKLIFRLSYPLKPDYLKRLLTYQNSMKSFFVYDNSTLHAKIYLFKSKDKPIAAIIGSSNYTYSGIESNKEFNVLTETNLKNVEDYLKFIELESDCKLSKAVVDKYFITYKEPIQEYRYKGAKLNQKHVIKYKNILEKYDELKGILEIYNTTRLPFTYLFDYFTHICKTEYIKHNLVKEPAHFNKKLIINTFKLFLQDYSNDAFEYRLGQLKKNKEIVKNLNNIPSEKIREFYFSIHSISSGSGSGVRQKNIEEINISYLKQQLDFIINFKLNMSEKYALALIDKNLHGEKIPYVGKSCVGEIPNYK